MYFPSLSGNFWNLAAGFKINRRPVRTGASEHLNFRDTIVAPATIRQWNGLSTKHSKEILSRPRFRLEDSRPGTAQESSSSGFLLLPAATTAARSGGSRHSTIPASLLIAGRTRRAMVQPVVRAYRKSTGLPHDGHTSRTARLFRFAFSN